MNLMSAIVGVSIMGATVPMIAQMSIQPMIAQKRSTSFSQAESLAVTFAGNAEANQSLPDIPEGCSVSDPNNSVYSVTCTNGTGQFIASASRSFRILDEIDDSGSGGRNFAYETPEKFDPRECPTTDPWGVNGFNASGAYPLPCKPFVIFNSERYHASDPNSWLFDINNHNGWGHHERY